jgi:hypothetical protein
MDLYKLYKSTRKNKKFDIYIVNPKTGRILKVSFGDSRYEDYTIHKDKQRRERYRNRHRNDKLDDITSAGFWSYHVLWGNSSNLNTALKQAIKMSNDKRYNEK